jgi:hypothetical protein
VPRRGSLGQPDAAALAARAREELFISAPANDETLHLERGRRERVTGVDPNSPTSGLKTRTWFTEHDEQPIDGRRDHKSMAAINEDARTGDPTIRYLFGQYGWTACVNNPMDRAIAAEFP